MNTAKDALQRVLLAAGTETYRHADTFPGGLDNLDAVPEELQAVVESLEGLGYKPEPDSDGRYLLNPDVQVLEDAIRSAARKAQVAVIYYTGHGLKPDRRPYYVLTADSIASNLPRTALEPRNLLIHLLAGEQEDAAEQPLVLVILDCCYSGAGGVEMLRESMQEVGNPNVWVLASASSIEEAQQGLFAQAFAAALRSPKIGILTEFIPFDLFLDELNSELASHRPDQQARLIRGEITGIPKFFPNRDYVPEVAGLTVEEQQVWLSRLRAAPEHSTATGFYLTGMTGRVRAVEDIAAWLRDPADHGLAVVTGSPGSGKSTLLALPVLLSNKVMAATLLADSPRGSLPVRAAELFAGLPIFGIYAGGMDPYQATRTIAEHLGRQAKSPADLIDDIKKRREASPRIVVFDAVDESDDPKPLMDTLVLPLSRCPQIKVLIGTRRHLIPRLEDSKDGSHEKALLVDLDADNYRDPQAMTEYARQLLLAAHESDDVRTPFRDASDEIAAAVAATIAERATAAPSSKGQAESFLLARLLARAVRGRERAPDLSSPGWADRLPADVSAAFDEDLARLGQRQSTTRALLSALAWAQGPGLPWENVWVPIARALAAEDGGKIEAIDDPDDVRWLLDNAGGYVVEDLGPDQRSVFRPFHELLAAHLRGEPGQDAVLADPATAEAWQSHRQQFEAVITQALLDTVPANSRGHRDWELAHPYLRTYLARHAHAAGPKTFGRLVTDLDYLAVADPAVLTPLLTPSDPALRTIAWAYRRARPLLGSIARENAAYLQEAVLTVIGHPLEQQHIRPMYRTLMAPMQDDGSLLTVSGNGSPVNSVALAARPDEGLILASGDSGGMVRLSDPDTGNEAANPPNNGSPVNSVAFAIRTDGRLLLATGGEDGKIRLWNPDTSTQLRDPLNHGPWVGAMVFATRADGSLLLATAGGGIEGMVRLWNPDTGCQTHEPLHHGGWVASVAFATRPEGNLLLATAGGSDGMVRLWDPDTGVEAADPLNHGGPVTSVAFATRTDGSLLLATAGNDGIVRLWNPDTGTQTHEPLHHGDEVISVALTTPPSGNLRLATAGGTDGIVRLWNPDTATETSSAIYLGTQVYSVALAARSDGSLLLASGDVDGRVRLWDPDIDTGPGALDNNSPVNSVAFAPRTGENLLLATAGGNDGIVRLWNPDTGTESARPFSLGKRVSSVVFAARTGGNLLLATLDSDGMMQLWDPDTGTETAGPFNLGMHVDSAALAGRLDGSLLLASGGIDGIVRLLDPDTGAETTGPLNYGGLVTSLAFATRTDGSLLLAAGGYHGTVRLWDPDTGVEAADPLNHGGPVTSVAFATRTDGSLLLATAGNDGIVRLWDPHTGTVASATLTHSDWASSVAFATQADGSLLLATAGGSDRLVRLWDPDTGTAVMTLQRRTPVISIALHGSLLAIATREGLTVLEALYPLQDPSGIRKQSV